jgi:hypothetical protein
MGMHNAEGTGPHGMCPVLLQGVIAVEGLDLTHVEPGWYHQICLPAKMMASDGAPIRCVLQHLGEAGASHNEL